MVSVTIHCSLHWMPVSLSLTCCNVTRNEGFHSVVSTCWIFTRALLHVIAWVVLYYIIEIINIYEFVIELKWRLVKNLHFRFLVIIIMSNLKNEKMITWCWFLCKVVFLPYASIFTNACLSQNAHGLLETCHCIIHDVICERPHGIESGHCIIHRDPGTMAVSNDIII